MCLIKYVQEKTYHNNGLLHPYALCIKKEIDKECNNYRYISGMNCVGKLLSRVIKKIEVMIKAKISEEGMEFTAGKSCLDNVFYHEHLIAKQKEKNKETHLVFVDLEEAYIMVPQKLLWSVIREMGVPQEILVVIQKMYAKNEVHVKIGNRISTGFETTKGLKWVWIITNLIQDLRGTCPV